MLVTNRQKMIGLIGLLIVLLAAMWMSIVCGYTDTSWRQAALSCLMEKRLPSSRPRKSPAVWPFCRSRLWLRKD
ncbi:siderophore ABC transporter permease [Geobacillus stearothermophilus]|nr:siderophore ABC transporter permease [Geobacillus stearothermophilus]